MNEECDREMVLYLESKGILHIMRMCHWLVLKKTKAAKFKPKHLVLQKQITKDQLLTAVTNDTFFGFISVSIEVSDQIMEKIDWLNISYLFDRRRGSSNTERLMFVEQINNTLLFRYQSSGILKEPSI